MPIGRSAKKTLRKTVKNHDVNLVLKNKSEEPIKEKIIIKNDNIEIYNDNKSVSLHTY